MATVFNYNGITVFSHIARQSFKKKSLEAVKWLGKNLDDFWVKMS